MTWNVRYFGHGWRGLRATTSHMKRVARGIATLEPLPEAIALQDVETSSLRAGIDHRPQLDRFLAHLHQALGDRKRYRAHYYPAHRYSWSGGPALYTTGLAVLVDDSLDVASHNADDPHDITHRRKGALSGLKQRRIVGHVHLTGDGIDLDLFNTHLSLPAFRQVGLQIDRNMGQGGNQLREVRRLLNFVRRRRSAAHAIVVGDFNSAPGSRAYRAMVRDGWTDGFADHIDHHDEVMRTWSTARFAHRRMHIDHVFSTPGVEWIDFEPHTACRGGPFHGLSDHAPKVGTLRFQRSSNPNRTQRATA